MSNNSDRKDLYRDWLNEGRKNERVGCGAIMLALVLWGAGVAAAWFIGGPATLAGAMLMLAAGTLFIK
jgi:fatty acid desaturase